MSRLLSFALVCATTSFVWAEQPKPIPGDDQTFTFMSKSGPVRIRLHLQVEGHSFQASWNEIVATLFRFLDYDGNGVLNAQEADRAPSLVQIRQLIQGSTEFEAEAAPPFKELSGGDAKGATLEQLKSYYLRIGAAPWQIDTIRRVGGSDENDEKLIAELGIEKPALLTRERLRNADRLVAKLDLDRDEIIDVLELTRNGYGGGFGNPEPLKANSGAFRVADHSKPTGSVPEIAVLVKLDGPPSEAVRVLRPSGGISPPNAMRSSRLRIGSSLLSLSDETVEIVRTEGLQARQDRVERMGAEQFGLLDRNSDGMLDNREVFQPPFGLVALMRVADRNSDGKLARAEHREFLALQKKMVTRGLIITLVDRGRWLFDFLDSDRDHRLSRRELKSAWDRLLPWADAKAGTMARDRIPHQYQIVISQGRLPRFNSDPAAVSVARPETRLQGPTWFRKMDRNADGDVSLAEFLGTAAQFRRLDLDSDGLISLSEAEAVGESPK